MGGGNRKKMSESTIAAPIRAFFSERSDWYRAMTLAERLVSLRDQPAHFVLSERNRAQQHLQAWKEQPPFEREDYLTRRLALDGLTEEEFRRLLAMPEELLQQFTPPPPWLLTLQKAFSDTDADAFILPDLAGNEVGGFLSALKPLLKIYLERLQAGLQDLARRYSPLPFDPQTMLSLLFAHVPGRILPKLMRTLVLELNVARVQGRLQGETSEERFYNFLTLLGNTENLLTLLAEYTVLARLLVETLEQWVCYELEICTHLCQDWQEILAHFPQAHEAGPLVEIQGDKGDLHREGRSVCILVWRSGFRLVYKPRSLASDLHFQEVLTWVNARGFQPAFRPLRIIDKKYYGWSEWVEVQSSSSRAEVARFYQRQGGYLALLYALEAIDIHSENLIAAGEHPILIDLEALLQPRAGQSAPKQGYIASHAMDYSVLRVRLLPQRFWSNEEAAGLDISGLGGQGKQKSPIRAQTWVGIGTDQMRLDEDYIEMTLAGHRPTLNGQDVDTVAFCDDVVAGFTRVYRLLIQQRDELLQKILPRFANDEIRCVLRRTHTYGKILADSYHPDALRDALVRERLLDRLWVSVEPQPYLEQVLPSERADLQAGDIPMFATKPISRDLFSSHGECIPDFFETSALEMVQRRLASFSDLDLEKQTWIIRASFTNMTLGSDGLAHERLLLRPDARPGTSERLLKGASAVGDRLEQLALYHEESVGWLGVELVHEREWHLLPAGIDLHSGLSGMTFFLAYLGVLSGEERHLCLARKALATLRSHINDQKTRAGFGLIGAFNGIGAYIYLLSHLGALWEDVTFFKEAEELASLLPELVERDEMFDIMGGAAGCIAALLSLYAVAPSESTLALARNCGDHLIAHARPQQRGVGWSMREDAEPLTGFSHGAAGIAWSLLRLFAVSNEERFRHTALAAMEYERGLFSPEQQNWPDLRRVFGSTQPVFMAAWCHGAAGITLARLDSLALVDDGAIREEIEAGLRTTLEAGFGSNHSLCHGALGNLEVFLRAAQVLKPFAYQETVKHLSAMIIDSIEQQGWVTGIPQGVETPGFMTGLAGIGYGLLRLAFPQNVPSALLLEPPSSRVLQRL
jgi:type 2 lantibiotic biosynthesis protein LanM